MNKLTLFKSKGSGSAIAESFLRLAGLEYASIDVRYDQPGPGRDELKKINPLCQVPTLILPDGTGLTETLAIAHYAHRHAPKRGLVPETVHGYLKFYRWISFIVAAVYPTWIYGDDPTKWLPGASGETQALLRSSTDEHRKNLWLQLSSQIEGPYFLGEHLCAIDVYLAVMSHWRPGRKWFEQAAPKILEIEKHLREVPEVRRVLDENF